MLISPFRIRQAIDALFEGRLIAYPTEGVWGLGCDPENPSAVMDLLDFKNRPMEKGLILVAGSIEQLEPYIYHLSSEQQQTLIQKWPGPHTWLVPCNEQVPEWISGDQETVALRVSSHPVIRALCYAFGGPIVSTSANITGSRAALNLLETQLLIARQQRPKQGQKHVTLVPGSLIHPGKPSTIQDLISNKLLRT